MLGLLWWIAAAALILPAALMASTATLRVARLVRYGVPAYSGGAAPASLHVALYVCGVGAIAITALLFGASALCQNAVNWATPASGYSYAVTPGFVALGFAFMFLSAALALMRGAALTLGDVPGVGCNDNVGCCCRFNVSLNKDESYAATPLMAAAHA